MKEKFPNLTKEKDFQEAQRVPNKLDPWEHTTKAQHNYITQDEREGENLKSSKRKGELPTKEFP